MPEGALPKGGWFICFCLGFIAGVALAPLINWCLICLIIISLSGGLIIFLFKKKIFKIISLGCFIVGCLVGVGRYEILINKITHHPLKKLYDQTVILNGKIVSQPFLKDKNVQFDVLIPAMAKAKLRVWAQPYPQFFYGDQIKLECRLEAPQSDNFNYERYLARYKIYALCFKPKLTKLATPDKSLVYYLLSLKNYLLTIINHSVNEPEASLVGSVIFGAEQGLAEDIANNFRRTGLTHIMAVSGFNVSLLAVGLGLILFTLGLKRKLVFILTSLVIISYVVMVGAPASATRAGIMSLIILWALSLGRLVRFINIIILTAAGTLMFNPLLLSADIGWQLSFLALLGLIYLQPPLAYLLNKISISKLKWLVEILAATLAAQLATIPITLYNFGQVSLIAPLANVLVVGFIPLLTVAALGGLLITMLIPGLASILFLPAFLISKYIILVVNVLSKISWAAINLN